MKFISNKRGFTLFELLVVITLIAILAVAVLAAINPIEQRRKAQDTSVNTSAAQIVSAYDRFYTTFGCYPDTYDPTATPPCSGDGDPVASDLSTDVGKMVTSGELKDTSIFTRLNAGGGALVWIGDSLNYCYAPSSKSFTELARFDATGGTGTTHYCVPASQL